MKHAAPGSTPESSTFESSAPTAFTAAASSYMVFGLTFLLTLYRIGAKPFWLDESFTALRSRLPLPALIHDSFVNHHLPTYFLLLHALIPADASPFILRLPSALFGAASVALVFLAGVRIAGYAAGAAAALILGLSPALIGFSQEARSYTLVMALVLVALHGMIGILDARQRERRAPWLLYGVGTFGAVMVLGDSILWMVFANLAMIPPLVRRQGLGRRWLAANLLVLAAAAPFYALMNGTVHGNYQHGFNWIPRLEPQRLWMILSSVYLGRISDSVSFRLIPVSTPPAVLGLLALGLPALAVFGFRRLADRPDLRRLLLLAFAGLPVLLILVSLVKPVLLPRYLFWSEAPFALLAGIGAAGIGAAGIGFFGAKLAQAAGLAVMALPLALTLAPYFHAETKPRWDLAARDLALDMRPGDRLLLSDYGGVAVLRLYLPPGADKRVLGHATTRVSAARTALADGHRVWMVYGRAGQGVVPGWYAYAPRLTPLGEPAVFKTAGMRVRIALFDPASEAAPLACSGAPASPAAPLAGLPQHSAHRCG